MRTESPAPSRQVLFAAAAATLLPLLFAAGSGAAPAAPPKVQYNRDIRPILAENCFPCHGPDSAARKADLRLDRAADATQMRGGHAAIVKGSPDLSEMIRRVTGKGALMPPPASGRTLTPKQIATLKRWVSEGAEYEKHWSLIPPSRPALPPLAKGGIGGVWVRNPIDRFVLARLEKEHLTPAPEADRRTLARRVCLDLTGLPPDPADVEAFVKDKSPDAYEKLVDKYLASPQYGEHRARYWLDAARYADSNGIHFDNFREMWAYRDWVIKAFNANMPFDEFTIENLAGDLLPNHTLDQQVGSGFNRCNITTNEGGAIDEEYRVLYARDRTETTSQVWLGTTMGCSVCHDHKFDPITMRDFYSMSAFFNNLTEPAMDGNIKDTPPIVAVPLEQDRPRFEALKTEIPAARQLADARKAAARADFDKWLSSGATADVAKSIPSSGLRLSLPLSEGQGKVVNGTLDGKPVSYTAAADPAWSIGHVAPKAFQRKMNSGIEIPDAGDFDKDQKFSYAAWVKLSRADNGGAVFARMDDQHDFRGWDMWLENGRVGTHIISKWPEDALKVVTREQLSPGVWHHVCITYNGGANLDAVRIYVDGQEKGFDAQANALKSTIRTTVPFTVGQRHTTSGVDGVGIADIRLYDRALNAAEAGQLAQATRAAYLVSQGADKIAGPEKDELFTWWLNGEDAQFRSLNGNVATLIAEENAIRARGTSAHVMQDKSGDAMAFVLNRGEYDKRREEVHPITPASLPPMTPDEPRNRLGLAKWLLRPDNPLTARVTVNRFWQELFGQGIVRTPGDFGVTGDLPSHPELLDWLAVEFREKGWDVKKLYRLIVTSATYRQAAVLTTEKREKDPQNRLLSRGPRFRMDAEMVRDYALAASGLLVKKIGGPSVRPYQPDGVWEAVAMPESNTRNYKRDMGESLYRRSMYTLWKRAAPPASMDIFNAPSREVCTVRRERTDTPLQALVTLNDIQFIEAARNLAQRALKQGGQTTESRADFIASRLLARPLTSEEMAVVQKSLTGLDGYYKSHEKDADMLITTGESKADPTLKPEKLAAWTMLTNQMMNMDEVLNK